MIIDLFTSDGYTIGITVENIQTIVWEKEKNRTVIIMVSDHVYHVVQTPEKIKELIKEERKNEM